ncbi:MAG: retroviral-like aspartic protease [Planctomycetes bacterium]|nr:retroviral-like aspartic protease [Planctomycetota bacterium]
MGRVFGKIQVNGKRFRTLFDSGATNSYIRAGATKGLLTRPLPVPRPTGIGGKTHQITELCVLMGTLEGKPIEVTAYVLDEIGRDAQGRRIDLLFGALAMQAWNIIIVPKEERLDLSHYPKEFIEFPEAPAAGISNVERRMLNDE